MLYDNHADFENIFTGALAVVVVIFLRHACSGSIYELMYWTELQVLIPSDKGEEVREKEFLIYFL